jgi:hypothetical protein
MAEDLTEYLTNTACGAPPAPDIDTIERMEIMRDLRMGEFDVLVGINLLRKGWTCLRCRSLRFSAPRTGGSSGLAVRSFDRQSRGATIYEPRDHVRRSDDGVDAARHRRDGSAPQQASRIQPETRNYADEHQEVGRRCDGRRARRRRGSAAAKAEAERKAKFADIPTEPKALGK